MPNKWIGMCGVCLLDELRETGDHMVRADPYYGGCVVCGKRRENIFLIRIPEKEAELRFSHDASGFTDYPIKSA